MSVMVIGLNKNDAIIIQVPGYEPVQIRIAQSESKSNVRLVIEAQKEVNVGRVGKSTFNELAINELAIKEISND